MTGRPQRPCGVERHRPTLALLSASVLWGTAGTASALAATGANPEAIGAARLAVGSLALLGVCAACHRRRHLVALWRWVSRRWVLAAGVATALYQAAFFQAVSSTGVAVGTLIVLGSAPTACGLLARWWSAEALPGGWVAATSCAIVGCALLVLPDAHGTIRPIGVALAAVAGACYGVYTVSAKRLLSAGHDPLAVLATTLAAGAVLLAPLLIGGLRPLLDLRGIVLVAWLGIVATALAYLLFARGLGTVAAAAAGTLGLAEPLTAAALGVVVLGERPGLIAGAGATLLLTGLIIAALAAPATTAAPLRSAARQTSAA